jgi:DNA-binding response OmpR family regulator
MDGLELCRRVRAVSADLPVMFLTSRDEEFDRVLGLELGADDYITKPFSMRELAARVRAVLRRVGKQDVQAEILRAADITLDRSGRLVKVGERPVDLTASEFDLLAVLMAAPGRSFTRLELLERLQGTAYEGYERTIDVHIHNLRNKIEPEPSHPVYIETLYGAGYRFAAQVERN